MTDKCSHPETISIDGTVYSRANAPPPNGKRAVVVVDRGWLFAGDVEDKNGRILLTRAVHIFRFESIGFDGMIKNPKSDKVFLRKLETNVDIPKEAEIFRIPVVDNWGL